MNYPIEDIKLMIFNPKIAKPIFRFNKSFIKLIPFAKYAIIKLESKNISYTIDISFSKAFIPFNKSYKEKFGSSIYIYCLGQKIRISDHKNKDVICDYNFIVDGNFNEFNYLKSINYILK